ncbi:MAG: hypothetical protein VB957_03335 [Pseudomonadales bacterium]
MSNVIYAIVFKGEIIDGFQPISVKAHMAKLLKADVEKMKALFSGKQIVIKRTPDKTEAIKYATALKKIGADIKVRAIKTEETASSKVETKHEAATESPGLGLAPNEGFIVEPAAPVPAPDLDLSSFVLAENDGSLIIEPTEHERLEIDLSEFSVKDNDGTPLIEASNEEVPVVEVPDFGLDVAGAMLETLPDTREKLKPNTTGMSLAMAGSDLLEPEEKDQTPIPKAPDTSSINLVPNFD